MIRGSWHFLIWFLPLVAWSQNQSIDPKESSAYTWRILEDLSWPEGVVKTEFRIHVLGNSDVLRYMKSWQSKRKINGARIRVFQVGDLSSSTAPHLIYIPKSSDQYLETVAWQFREKPVLIISESKGQIKKGAHVDIYNPHGELKFEVGTGNLKRSGLSFERELLDVAVKEQKKESHQKEPSIKPEDVKIELVEPKKISQKEAEELDDYMDDLSDLASSSKKKVKIDTEDLQALLEKQKEQEEEMEKNQKRMERQRRNINKMKAEQEKKEKEIEEQNQEFEEKQKELQNLQLKEERINAVLERKEKILKGKELTIKEQLGEIQSHKYIIYVMGIFLAIAIILGYFIYRNYKAKVLANRIIEEQKAIVEEKNQKITDSITYAKRLQSAILPSDRIVKDYLDQSFIYYQPKDIVAGDFYWMDQIDGKIIFAAADCTGHGVPGAFVSIVCHNALSRSVREFGIKSPGLILDKSRELVVEQFEKSDESVKDGMDISLCSYDVKKKELEFAGAHNRLFLVRKKSDNPQVDEIKGDKQPIGLFDDPKPFTNHKIKLEPGDCIYLSTDGFPDQFGGPRGKKFMYKRFKELLESLHGHMMDTQKGILKQEFESWRGEEEQLDDVCVLGMKA